MDIYNRLSERLAEREKQHTLRKLPATTLGIDFLSNDYLGLARSPVLKENIERSYSNLPQVLNGSTGSRLLSGNTAIAEELESFLAQTFNGSAALVFNSGYTANLALLASVPQKGDTIILDSLAHACMHEGARLSFADKFSFKHNDLEDLERKLKIAKGVCFVVVESVYSMDGDQCLIRDLLALSKKYDAHVIIDEAHSTGIMGVNGSGLICELGLEEDIFARVYTFGKAMGVHGAVVVGSEVLKQYLVNFARAFIYTTALPTHSLVSIKEAFLFLKSNQVLQLELSKKVQFFNNYVVPKLDEVGVKPLPGNSPIKALIVPGSARIKKLANHLEMKGFVVKPILSPTVQRGAERLRICLHSFNTTKELELLTEEILFAQKVDVN